MARVGFLEMMAHADLEALHEEMARRYAPGGLEALGAADPGWRAALDRAEREVGELYEALRQADATLVRWRRGLAELSRLWARAAAVPVPADAPALEEVA
ncbi:MAG: hypothetical protein HYV62_13555 [Candidatus Rokubacteria bacterium]|nr:hypothetical protein [Candidatus Rokubacteria bacterium]